MNIDLVRAIPTQYMLIGIAALVAASMGFGYVKGSQHEALKAARFEAATEALGKAQVERNKETEARQNANLKEIKSGFKTKLKLAGDNAVANYVARYGVCNANSSQGGLSKPAAGVAGDDATGAGIVVTDGAAIRAGFIRDCAIDAAVLDTWQQWAVKNHIPVKD
jgi:hypothetical protein